MDDYHKKLDELISKVDNGKQKYKKSPLFNKVVNCLAYKHEPIQIMSDLIDIIETQQDEFEKYQQGDTRPILIKTI